MADLFLPFANEQEIKERFPLHLCVWNNNLDELDQLLKSKLYNHEAVDPHGRTPLLLAIALGLTDAVKVLLNYKCDASVTDKQGWNATQEAVATGDPELLSLIIQHREYQQFTLKSGGINEILELLEEADDFYVEMKWEFLSWVPLISRMCPSDSYKIWKSGASVRVDTTLAGFDHMSWQRGNKSFIFKGGARCSHFFDIDHDTKSYWKESINIRDESIKLSSLRPPASVINSRLNSANVTTVLDHEHISFTRQKGFLGFGGDKIDFINGYQAKVFGVSGVELVTRTRLEHLTQNDIIRIQDERQQAESRVPSMLSFIHKTEAEECTNPPDVKDIDSKNPYCMSVVDYFNPRFHPNKDIGRLRKMTLVSQKFSATLALSDTFPLSLQDQVLPVINLMAHSSSHFAKLRDFIALQLPAGFPLKIEIPLFRVLNARITFNNLNGTESCPDGVITLNESDPNNPSSDNATKSQCVIDKSIFEVHRNYRDMGVDTSFHDTYVREEDEELLQLAIQQSLISVNQSDECVISEESNPDYQELQRNISFGNVTTLDYLCDNEEEQLRKIIELSTMEGNAIDQRIRDEEEELQRVLALSLFDT